MMLMRDIAVDHQERLIIAMREDVERSMIAFGDVGEHGLAEGINLFLLRQLQTPVDARGVVKKEASSMMRCSWDKSCGRMVVAGDISPSCPLAFLSFREYSPSGVNKAAKSA